MNDENAPPPNNGNDAALPTDNVEQPPPPASSNVPCLSELHQLTKQIVETEWRGSIKFEIKKGRQGNLQQMDLCDVIGSMPKERRVLVLLNPNTLHYFDPTSTHHLRKGRSMCQKTQLGLPLAKIS